MKATTSSLEVLLNRPVAWLGLSTGARNAVAADGVATVGQLRARTEDDLYCLRNLGATRLAEIKAALAAHGLALADVRDFALHVVVPTSLGPAIVEITGPRGVEADLAAILRAALARLRAEGRR